MRIVYNRGLELIRFFCLELERDAFYPEFLDASGHADLHDVTYLLVQ